MALWDKLRVELNRAGEVAQDAIDEGKTRLEEFRARQRADKAAQAPGYAVFHARQAGREIDADTYARLSSELAAADAEVRRHQEDLASRTGRRDATPGAGGPGAGGSGEPASGGGPGTSDPQPPV
jgi:hypothetical protein